MARDFDLIRKIMLDIREREKLGEILRIEIEGYSVDQIQFQLVLLKEEELIVAYDFSASNKIEIAPTRLTWAGNDFLDLAMNDNNWNKAKKIADGAGATTLEILRKILVEIATEVALGMLKHP
ncbi:MAG TPA: DUF2513 domain-containing protein [Bellilinea sp.]|nr:DUF2513 domain-containing protein [Bellilinea sp.]